MLLMERLDVKSPNLTVSASGCTLRRSLPSLNQEIRIGSSPDRMEQTTVARIPSFRSAPKRNGLMTGFSGAVFESKVRAWVGVQRREGDGRQAREEIKRKRQDRRSESLPSSPSFWFFLQASFAIPVAVSHAREQGLERRRSEERRWRKDRVIGHRMEGKRWRASLDPMERNRRPERDREGQTERETQQQKEAQDGGG